MSQENLEIVRRAIRSFLDTGEFDSELYDAAVEFTTRGDPPFESSTYRGLDGLARGAASFREVWASWDFVPREFIETEDAVVVPFDVRLRAHSGIELETEETWSYVVREARICGVTQYATKHEALEAVGLPE